MEKSLEQKLAECRQVIIQNVDKSMQNTMVFRYMKETRIDNDVKKYNLNNKDGYITFEFNTPEQARNFYEKANFKDKILIRPFNIYLSLTLSDNEMKKYYFEGLSEDNMRRMFELARTVGVVKVYTSYTSTTSTGKLKPNGIISFIRKEDVSEKEFAELSEKLNEIGVKLSPYKPDKGIKCSVILTNFYTGNLDASEEQINNETQRLAEDLMKKALKDQSSIAGITALVKRREVPTTENQEGVKVITKVRAIVEFKSSQDAIDNFEEIRIAFLGLGEARATLNFHNAENNSFISLFSSGLVKSNEAWTDKEFENELIKCFRHVNKHVVQVNVFPITFNKTYVARVYLKSEEAGKDFIVDYPLKREFFFKNYKDNASIKFNINVDDKTIKKIKTMQKRATLIMEGIKNETDNQRKANKRAANQTPLMREGGPFMYPNPNIPPGIQGMQGMPNIPPGMQGMGMRPPMGGMMPPMGMRPVGMGPEMSTADIDAKIAKTIQDKTKIVESTREPNAERALKQTFVPLLRYLLNTRQNVPMSEVGVLSGKYVFT